MLFPESECYFLAFDAVKIQSGAADVLPSKRFLVALNYLHKACPTAQAKADWVRRYHERGFHVMLDSGCFSLSFERAREQGMDAADVFMMSPTSDIWRGAFEQHLELYCESVRACGEYLTSYVEVDIGSLTDRAATRQRCVDQGLAPLPVFRLFRDPLDALDDMLAAHPALCIAGTAFCPMKHRVRGWHEVWRKWKRINPACRLHVLGVTPCSTFNSFGFSSSDSSTFTASCRYGQSHGYNYTGADSRVHWLPAIPLGEVEGVPQKIQTLINATAFSHSVFALAKHTLSDEKRAAFGTPWRSPTAATPTLSRRRRSR